MFDYDLCSLLELAFILYLHITSHHCLLNMVNYQSKLKKQINKFKKQNKNKIHKRGGYLKQV